MIVDQIDVVGVAAIEAEDSTPVGSYGHSPEPGQVALERVQPETGQVHLADLVSFIETRENALDLVDLIRPELAPIAFLIQPPQSAMLKAPDHGDM
jgi:hypothetical protein